MQLPLELQRLLSSFRESQSGNIAVIFAIAMIPMIGMIGAAVDYTRASNARTAMQAALDSTALMISKEASGLTASQITTKAQAYFNALYNHTEVTNVAVTATYTPASAGVAPKVVMTSSGAMPTSFLGVVGFQKLDINVGATTGWSNTRLRVAMALDNTGSMADSGKMAAMQGGAKSLIDQLSATAANAGDVYISMVPFSKDVNVGASNHNANWIDFTALDASSRTCKLVFQFPFFVNQCTSAPHSAWTGCVGDRAEPYDTLVTLPTTTNLLTLFPADDYFANNVHYCDQAASGNYLQPITPLSYNWSMLKSNIDGMQPTGGTNQQIGLAWAWMSLQPAGPLNAPALDTNFTYTQAIILLSDGLNTENRIYGDGSNPAPEVDARQRILCDNIKAAGITIYSIQVNTGGDPQSAVMAYCASGSANFFYLTSANQVLSAFSAIGTSLSRLHIAK